MFLGAAGLPGWSRLARASYWAGSRPGARPLLFTESMETESLLVQTKKLLRQYGLHARKGLGQHFLVDGSVLRTILEAAELTPDDVVLEVGPGLGILTRELAQRAGRVIAVELDDRLAQLLKENLAESRNVTVINENILDIDPTKLPLGKRYKVVANLPYYITSPVLRHFLEASVKPTMILVMVQKEVARVIVARPGERSVLSISVQFYGRPRIVGYVRARAFYPAPEVDSAILRIDLYAQPPIPVTDPESFFILVRAGFSAARKQIANALAQGLKVPKSEALSLLERAGISPQRRAETLTIEEWGELWQAFAQAKKEATNANTDRTG